ncbi:MAG: helix-turn-helix domain-containing protein [Erysipelotrichaceae bacterium]|nr:helix-turn-helix domain-containing protein [Erysipelotrichaceae bacterium]
MYFKENLRFLRKRKLISQNELADFLGYKSFTTIQKWEDGTSTPNMSMLTKISKYFNVDLNDLINIDISKLNKKIPVIGIIRGGPAIFADQNISDYEYVSYEESNDGEYFYLDIVGDSMKNIRILEGDRVYIRKQSTLENGEVGVVLIGEEATLKRVYYEDDKLILKSENELYSPMIFTKKDVMDKEIKILGKLIHNKIRY